jgi:lysophospholipase L1-like esterase
VIVSRNRNNPRQIFASCMQAALCLASLAAPAFAQTSPPVAWTAAWAMSPEQGGASSDFEKVTLRQAIRPSISGTAARVRISNLFGDQPLRVADVHFAQSQGTGPSIVAGTDVAVTFGGKASITIAAGAEVTSDAIDVAVTAQKDYAVSLFLPATTPIDHVTFHQDGFENVWIATGDVSGSTNINNTNGAQSVFFLTNLDVQNAKSTGAIVALGASITDGDKSAFQANNRWTDLLAGRLVQAGLAVGVDNQGIQGNQQDNDGAGLSALHRFSHDVLGQADVKYVVYSDDVINELGSSNPPPTADFLLQGYRQMISQAHQAGVKFICSTLTPFAADGSWTPAQEVVREQVNTAITTTNMCDGVIDFASAVADPNNPSFMLAAFNVNPDGSPGDNLHPNVAGHQAMANAINLGLFTANGVPPVSGPTRTDTLSLGQSLTPGQTLTSADGRFVLTLQTSGALTIEAGTTTLYNGGGSGTPATLMLEQDGNVIELDTSGKILFQTNTSGQGGQNLVMQNDGNLVLYTPAGKPLFATNTCCH